MNTKQRKQMIKTVGNLKSLNKDLKELVQNVYGLAFQRGWNARLEENIKELKEKLK